jgi:hypothetical protein
MNTGRNFSGSSLEDPVLEAVARSIIITCRSMDEDKWVPFTYSQYTMSILPRFATKDDKRAFEIFVERGFLEFEEGEYLVTDEFTSELAEFSTIAARGFAMPA